MTKLEIWVIEGENGQVQIRLFSDSTGADSTDNEKKVVRPIWDALDVLITEALKRTGVPFETMEKTGGGAVVEKFRKSRPDRKGEEQR